MRATEFSTSPADREALADALRDRAFLVVGLCAAWCNTCTEFRESFSALAAARGDATFVWTDIEDDADLVGDIDVENFPTIAVFHRGRLLHYGVSLPQGPLVGRLLASFDAASRTQPAEVAVTSLPERLAANALSAG